MADTVELAPARRYEADEAPVSRRVGKFLVLKKLGAGSMGTVYLAKDLELDRTVAVKFLHPRLAGDPDIVARLHAEARVANLIGDEHVAQVIEVGCIGPSGHYLAMEYLDGEPLSERVGRPLGAAVAVPILRQICSAIQSAHQHGVVHRDLKPENIFLLARPGGGTPFVKVLDFGIAKVMQPKPGSPRTASGQICGTPQYMAPEQCGGTGVDRRTDLYALGVIAYELVTGRVPFDGRNIVQVMLRHRDERPLPPYELEPTVPQALSDVIMRALEKRPDDRFATAAEMSEALARVRTREGHVGDVPADVRLAGGRQLMTARCTQLLSGGMFISTDEQVPPIGEGLSVVLHLDGLAIDCACEVSMHVGPAQAAAWGTARGFAARFSRLEPEAQALLDRVLRGDPLPRHLADPEIARLNKPHARHHGTEDLYALLGLPTGADASTIRRRARECRAKVEDALLACSAAEVRAQLQRTLARVDEAWRVLSEPSRRIEYDARRGNFRGVSVCIEGGVDAETVAACRRRYVESFPTSIVASQVHAKSAEALHLRGSHAEALADCELALTLDPLSAPLHALRMQLMQAIESQAMGSTSGEWRLPRRVQVDQRQVIGGVPASAAKTPPSARSDAQLSPDDAPAGV